MPLNLLPDDGKLLVDWSPEWVWRLFNLMRDTGTEDAFKNFMTSNKSTISSTAKFANEVKKFISENQLHTKNKDAAIIIASATCGCHGKS